MAHSTQNQIVMILGAKGYGKTWFARKLASRLAGKRKVLFLDTALSFKDSSLQKVSAKDLETFLNGPEKRWLAGVTEENAGMILNWLAGVVPNEDLNMILVLDEANLFCTSHTMHEGLRKLIALGRHSRLSMILIARDPQELNPRIRSQADGIICFRIARRRELQWCRDESPDIAAKLPRLARFEYLVLSDSPNFVLPKSLL